MQRCPDVLGDADGLIGAPEQATAEEASEEEHAIIPLRPGAGHVQLIEEPVKVEEGRGELVEDKRRTVEVDKRTLYGSHQLRFIPAAWDSTIAPFQTSG